VNDVRLSVQFGELSEVAELRWDGAIKLIREEVPDEEEPFENRNILSMRPMRL